MVDHYVLCHQLLSWFYFTFIYSFIKPIDGLANSPQGQIMQILSKVRSCNAQKNGEKKKQTPTVTSHSLHASVSVLNVEIYDRMIRKRLNNYSLLERLPGESLF